MACMKGPNATQMYITVMEIIAITSENNNEVLNKVVYSSKSDR